MSKNPTGSKVEELYRLSLEEMVPALGHDPDAAITPPEVEEDALLFKRVDPEFKSRNGVEVSVKWTRFTRFELGFSMVNFDFLVSPEQYALPRVEREIRLLHQGILGARVRPPKDKAGT